MATRRKTHLLPGTLDLLVLKALEGRHLNGLGIVRWIKAMTNDFIEVPQGSLQPCLKRLGEAELIMMRRGSSPKSGRTVLLYCHGKGGGNRLRAEVRKWKEISEAINKAVQS
jgi:PadR family transcriptional regulator PadR